MLKTKLYLFFCVVLVIVIAMEASDIIKNYSVKELYEDIIFTQITMESKQYVSEIEYDIKYGRDLEGFYNMNETLKNIEESSSYIEGAYIVSSKNKLLYGNGRKAVGNELYIPKGAKFKSNSSYYMYIKNGIYFIVSRIKNDKSVTAGYLILRVTSDAVSNTIADFINQNNIQSLIIGGEIIALALLIIRRAKPAKGKGLVKSLFIPLCSLLICAIIVDSGVAILRYNQIAGGATVQMVDKVSQSLQSSVDQVMEKGVPSDRLYDLSGWLEKNKSEMPAIASFSLENNEKITASVSRSYITGFIEKTIFRLSLLLLACILLCVLIRIGGMLYKRKTRTEFGVPTDVSKK